MLNDLEKMKAWKNRISKVEERVNAVTFPVYTTKDGRNFELFGSSVAVIAGGHRCLCTARHLIDEVFEQKSYCLIGANGRFEEVDLSSTLCIDSDTADVDLCLVKLKGECRDIQFLEQHHFSDHDVFGGLSWQFLQGYPLSKNKHYNLHENNKNKIHVGYINTVVKLDKDIDPPIERVSDESHLFFRYEETAFQSPFNEGVELRKAGNNLSLKGCSGCGLWNVHGDPENPVIELSGIFIAFKSGTGVATRSRYITEAVCKI